MPAPLNLFTLPFQRTRSISVSAAAVLMAALVVHGVAPPARAQDDPFERFREPFDPQTMEGVWAIDPELGEMLMGDVAQGMPDELYLVVDIDETEGEVFDEDARALMSKESYELLATGVGWMGSGENMTESKFALVGNGVAGPYAFLVLLPDAAHNQDWTRVDFLPIRGITPAHDHMLMMTDEGPAIPMSRADDEEAAAMIEQVGAEMEE